ncbi:MAG: polysaccharide pyruvyl transferase family protein, partial [Candidatus Omnitrophota bacterium]
FIVSNLNLSAQKYISYDDLSKNAQDYDIFICGSDQIWNPEITGLDPAYFLSFVPSDKKKVAYAASFGIPDTPQRYHAVLKKLLEGIECISVREKEGKRIINFLTGKNVDVVLDPTLLLNEEEWGKVSEPRPSLKGKRYVLCYYFQENKRLDNISIKCSKIMGIPRVIINASNKDRFSGAIPVFDAGPSEFIKLFKEASFVVTNSFHGVAFSINFKKPFFVDLLDREFVPRNSRLINILENLNLSTRLVSNFANVNAKSMNLDFKEAIIKLNTLKEKSLNFLKKSICE